jgi:hypothetical protein
MFKGSTINDRQMREKTINYYDRLVNVLTESDNNFDEDQIENNFKYAEDFNEFIYLFCLVDEGFNDFLKSEKLKIILKDFGKQFTLYQSIYNQNF